MNYEEKIQLEKTVNELFDNMEKINNLVSAAMDSCELNEYFVPGAVLQTALIYIEQTGDKLDSLSCILDRHLFFNYPQLQTAHLQL